MGHNTSRTQQEHLRRRSEVQELERWLVPGWAVDQANPRIVAIDTALAYLQRGQQILLRCSRPDCRRRVELDLKGAIEDGRAGHSLKQLIGALRCRHWSGCRLEEVSAIYPDGIPLIAVINEVGSLILVECENCQARILLPPRQMITRLAAAGRGNGATGVHKLGSVVRGPCRRCGRRKFRSDLVRGRAPGT